MPDSISEMLDSACIELKLKGRRKSNLITELAMVLDRGGKVTDLKRLAAVIIERENLASTGIGSGIAIPHAMSDTVKETLLAFGLKADGARFDSVDNQPVTLYFLLVGPEGSHTEHLKVLSRLSRYLHDDAFRIALRNADSPEAVIAAIKAKERSAP